MNGASPYTWEASPAEKSRVFGATFSILEGLFGHLDEIDFAVRLWNGELLTPENVPDGFEPTFTLVLTHPGALRRMFWPPNDFYAQFLGRWMAYSCAYFQERETDLDSAQAAKFEHICRKLRLQPGERLLDIGCGWGGLVVHAAEKYGVQATGITLSQPQVDYAREWITRSEVVDLATVENRDYRQIVTDEPYDKIVSVGMAEHVGRAKLSEYFEAAYRALRPGGSFLNHAIATHRLKPDSWLARTFLQSGQFMQRYVFPDGELVRISQMLAPAEAQGFEVGDVESLREHYALTLRNWIGNLESNYDRCLELKDERTYRTWRLYMAASVQGFESGRINVYQSLLSKGDNGASEVPLTRKDLYRE